MQQTTQDQAIHLTQQTTQDQAIHTTADYSGSSYPPDPAGYSASGSSYPYDPASYSASGSIYPSDPASYSGLGYPYDPASYSASGSIYPSDPASYSGLGYPSDPAGSFASGLYDEHYQFHSGLLPTSLEPQITYSRKRKALDCTDIDPTKYRRVDGTASSPGSQRMPVTSNGQMNPAQTMLTSLLGQGEPPGSLLTHHTKESITRRPQRGDAVVTSVGQKSKNDSAGTSACRTSTSGSRGDAVGRSVGQKSKNDSAGTSACRTSTSGSRGGAVGRSVGQKSKNDSAGTSACRTSTSGSRGGAVGRSVGQKSKNDSAGTSICRASTSGSRGGAVGRSVGQKSKNDSAGTSICRTSTSGSRGGAVGRSVGQKSKNDSAGTSICRASTSGSVVSMMMLDESIEFKPLSVIDGAVGNGLYYALRYHSDRNRSNNLPDQVLIYHATGSKNVIGFGKQIIFALLMPYCAMCKALDKDRIDVLLEYMNLPTEEAKKLDVLENIQKFLRYTKLIAHFFNTPTHAKADILKLRERENDKDYIGISEILKSLIALLYKYHNRLTEGSTHHPYFTMYVLEKHFLPVVLENVLLMIGNKKKFDPKVKISRRTCEILLMAIYNTITADTELELSLTDKFNRCFLNCDDIDKNSNSLIYAAIDKYIRIHNRDYYILNGILPFIQNKNPIEQFVILEKEFLYIRNLTPKCQNEIIPLSQTLKNRIKSIKSHIQKLRKPNTIKNAPKAIIEAENRIEFLQERVRTGLIPLLVNQIFDAIQTIEDLEQKDEIIRNIRVIERAQGTSIFEERKKESLLHHLITPPATKAFSVENVEQSMPWLPVLNSDPENVEQPMPRAAYMSFSDSEYSSQVMQQEAQPCSTAMYLAAPFATGTMHQH